MPTASFQKIIKYTTLTALFIFIGFSALFSEEPQGNQGYITAVSVPEAKKITPSEGEDASKAKVQLSKSDKSLTPLQRQARAYREEGLTAQRIGNLEKAAAYYQKAIQIDPLYAVVYNDLGVLYEAYGDTQRAEYNYLEAIKRDPSYLSPYTNLAMIYEERRDIDKAAVYWKKRWELDPVSSDPWAQKARQRYDDIMSVKRGRPKIADMREQEVMGLTNDVIKKKDLNRKSTSELAKEHFRKAKLSYQKDDEVTALKEAIDAQLLDPGNKDVEAFIEKVQHRLLSR